MKYQSFRGRIRRQPPPIGTMITTYCPDVVEALSLTGLDWLFLDMEHGVGFLAAGSEVSYATTMARQALAAAARKG